MSLTVEQLVDLADTGTVVVDAGGDEATVVSEDEWYSLWGMDVPRYYVAYADEQNEWWTVDSAIDEFGPFTLKETP